MVLHFSESISEEHSNPSGVHTLSSSSSQDLANDTTIINNIGEYFIIYSWLLFVAKNQLYKYIDIFEKYIISHLSPIFLIDYKDSNSIAFFRYIHQIKLIQWILQLLERIDEFFIKYSWFFCGFFITSWIYWYC